MDRQNRSYLGHQLKDQPYSKTNVEKKLREKTNKSKIRLSVLCKGQMFGEEDIINDRECTTTVVCNSTEATVYSIKAEEFIIRMGINNTWDIISARV